MAGAEFRRDDERDVDERDGRLEVDCFVLLVANAARGTSSSSLEEVSEDIV